MPPADDLPVSLTFDFEHGGYFGRWYCQSCDAAGIDDQPCPDEETALAVALANFKRNHARHAKPRTDAPST